MTTITIDIDWSSENHFPSQSIFCEICCSEEIPPEHQTICPKGHTFCITCAGMMAQRQITNYQKTLPCMSMEEECQAEFTEEEAKKFLNQILFKRWKELQIELFAKELGIEEPLEFCPFCDFYRVILETNKSKIFICGNQECKKWSCRECKTEDHLPLTCEEAEKVILSNTEDQRSKYIFEATLRRCPKCRIPIEKSTGVTFTKCGTNFCYLCKKDISSIRYGHFGHGMCGVYQDPAKIIAKERKQAEEAFESEYVQQEVRKKALTEALEIVKIKDNGYNTSEKAWYALLNSLRKV